MIYVIIFLFSILGWILFAWQYQKNSINKTIIESKNFENDNLRRMIDNERKIFATQLKLVSSGKINTDTLNSIVDRLHKKHSHESR